MQRNYAEAPRLARGLSYWVLGVRGRGRFGFGFGGKTPPCVLSPRVYGGRGMGLLTSYLPGGGGWIGVPVMTDLRGVKMGCGRRLWVVVVVVVVVVWRDRTDVADMAGDEW